MRETVRRYCLGIRAPPLRHGRHDGSRMNGVGPDTVLRVLDGRGLGEETHRALGRLVLRARVVRAHEAELGRDVDDGAATGPSHGGDHRARAEKDAGGVDGHDPLPVGEGGVLDPVAPADARVVDEDIELPIPAFGLRHRARPVGLAGDVEADERRFPARRADLLHRGLTLGLQHIAEHHLRAFLREQAPCFGAHSPRAAADQRDLPSSLMCPSRFVPPDHSSIVSVKKKIFFGRSR